MPVLAFATDYDGTLAEYGHVLAPAIEALQKLKASGCRLLLVTGREMDDIIQVFPGIGIFDRVVSENGAVLYRPEDRSERLLAERPPERFFNALAARGVAPISAGRVIVSSSTDQAPKVEDAIRACDLPLHLIFNKGWVMALPIGVDKARGLTVALDELGISPHELAAVGDAENDVPMLTLARCAAVVSGAVGSAQAEAGIVLGGDASAGVIEFIDLLLERRSRIP